jgi:hypothetical protein
MGGRMADEILSIRVVVELLKINDKTASSLPRQAKFLPLKSADRSGSIGRKSQTG